MQDLRVTAIQSKLNWEDANANRAMFAEKINGIEGSNLIVLPEMFTTGFSMRSNELAETMDGPSVNWMKEMAASSGAAINGSVIIEDEGNYYNRSLFVRPDGEVEHYDKRHLFRMANEDLHFSEGHERKVVDLNGWKILLQVCYDLRFPVFARNRQDHHLMIYVANWPAPRTNAWSTLLRARAMENQSYVVGVNRVKQDGMGIQYTGASAILDTRGDELVDIPLEEEHTSTSVLSWDDMQVFREKFPIHKDADDFELKF